MARLRAGRSTRLRLSVGGPDLHDDEVREVHRERPLLFKDGKPVRVDELALSDGMLLTLDLRGDTDRRVGYRARATDVETDVWYEC